MSLSGGIVIAGAGDTCSASLSGGAIVWTLAGTTTYSVLPSLSCSGASGGTGAICPSIVSVGTPSLTASAFMDPTGTFHIGAEAIPANTSSLTGPGTILAGDSAVFSAGYVKFPGLAAGSGEHCLQVDTSGNVTNTGQLAGAAAAVSRPLGQPTAQRASWPGRQAILI